MFYSPMHPDGVHMESSLSAYEVDSMTCMWTSPGILKEFMLNNQGVAKMDNSSVCHTTTG
jgi:hypothetical protein